MIIISDVHGRSFWKEAVKNRIGDEEIVFLGDYVDNYPGEIDAYTNKQINNKVALENFKEIIEFAKNNANVTLLLGNHDVEYLYSECYPCRMDVFNKREIRSLFETNRKLFKPGKYYKEQNTIITHAGVSNLFLTVLPQLLGSNDENYNYSAEHDRDEFFDYIDLINELWETDDERLGTVLSPIGFERGGDFPVGSSVWIDWRCLNCREGEPRQIVGHSQYNAVVERGVALIRENCYQACLDCRAGFRVSLEDWKFNPITKIEDVRYV